MSDLADSISALITTVEQYIGQVKCFDSALQIYRDTPQHKRFEKTTHRVRLGETSEQWETDSPAEKLENCNSELRSQRGKIQREGDCLAASMVQAGADAKELLLLLGHLESGHQGEGYPHFMREWPTVKAGLRQLAIKQSIPPVPAVPSSGQATGNATPTTPVAEQSEGTAGSGKPLSAEERKRIFDSLEPADRKAYWSFHYAESKRGKKLYDWEAYELLKEDGIPDEACAGELSDYELPTEITWTRALRNVRPLLGESKYGKGRRRRSHGKSIVKGKGVERQLDDEG